MGHRPRYSEIGFKVKYLVFTNVSRAFKEFDERIYTTGEDFMSAAIDFWLNPAAIHTGDEKRNDHLKNADLFDVENYKEINFTANTYIELRNVRLSISKRINLKHVGRGS